MATNRSNLRKIIETDTSLSLAAVARACDVNPGALSSWLKSKYQGDNAKIDRAVKSFLEAYAARRSRIRIEFVETSVSRKITEVADLCRADCQIGVVSGAAGVGKTVALKQYAAAHPEILFVEVDFGYSAQGLFTELYEKLGLGNRGVLERLSKEVIARLDSTERMLIIDEAEYLPHRALDLLRRVSDKAGVGILLVGLPRLIHKLRGSHGEFAQLFSRVGIHVQVDGLTPGDTQAMVGATIPEGNGIWKDFHRASRGNARTLAMLLKRTIRSSRGAEITPELVESAAETLII